MAEENGCGNLTMKEEIVEVGQHRLTISLETVLAGHEDKVFAVQWRER